MRIDEVVSALEHASPEEIRDAFSQLAAKYSAKAESIYDKDPENNGTKAQPYSDLADYCQAASTSFEPDAEEAPGDELEVDTMLDARKNDDLTVSAAIERRRGSWGKH